MRKVYNERRRFAHAAFQKASSDFEVHDSRAGLHFCVHLPARVGDAAFSARAAELGMIAPALSGYYLEKPTLNGIVIGYAATSIPQATKAIHALRNLL